MKRTILDTNIIISSALGGALVLILERCHQGEFTVIVTSDILREYFEVLNRPKFKLKQEKLTLSSAEMLIYWNSRNFARFQFSQGASS